MTLQGQGTYFTYWNYTHNDTIPSTINVISDAATAPVPVDLCLNLNFDINTLCFEEDIKFFSFEKTLSHFKNIFGVHSLFIEVLMSKLKNPTKCVCISPQFCRLSCCPLRTECECKAAETARRECTATRTLPHCANQNCLESRYCQMSN